jgi:zinc transport system substrate-binding protein
MNKKKLSIVIVILVIAAGVLGYFGNQNLDANNSNGKIDVAVSIGPEEQWVNAVGGDKVNVTLMVPPSADPHTYEPLPGQLKQISNAKMYAEIGSPLEFETNYMNKIEAANPNMLIVNCSEGVTLIPNTAENESDTMDPHDWNDPKNAEIMVNNIYLSLVKEDPADQAYFEKNRDNYEAQLEALDNYTTQTLKDKNGTQILIFHPAFGYYAKDYNLTQVAVMINDEEPSPQRIALLLNIAKEDNITVMYNEPQYDPSYMQSIASQVNGRVITVNDLDPNYLQNMKNTADAFAQA